MPRSASRSLLHARQVRSRDKEFFTPLLRPYHHWIEIDHVEELRPTLKALRRNESWARSIAVAGQRFARSELAHANVLSYLASLLRVVAGRMADPIDDAPTSLRHNFSRIDTAADVGDAVRLHPRCADGQPPSGNAAGRCCQAAKRWRCCAGYDCPTALESVCASVA